MRKVFCDESGDPGLATDQGASPLFVLSLVAGHPESTHARFIAKQAEVRKELAWSGEFKWTKMRHALRMEYLKRSLTTLPDNHSAIWRKAGDRPMPHETAQVTMLRRCLEAMPSTNEPCRLIIDGERNRQRAREIRASLALAEVRFEPSHVSPYLQLADMLAGFHAADVAGGIRDLPKELQALRGFRSAWR